VGEAIGHPARQFGRLALAKTTFQVEETRYPAHMAAARIRPPLPGAGVSPGVPNDAKR